MAHGVDLGLIARMGSNESPYGPFPGVERAIAAALASANRYPDPAVSGLAVTLAEELGVSPENLLFGAGSAELIGNIAVALGGPGTNLVYGWPSFIVYRLAAAWAGSVPVEVPLEGYFSLDLKGIVEAVNDQTRVVYLCNPNNPTGTIKPAGQIEELVGTLSDHVLVVIDEAYHHFAQHPDYRSALPLALTRPNLVVLRTFSKVYALAALRIGYAVGMPETLAEIRKVQTPFSVSGVAQAAALASLGQPEEVRRRVEANAAGRRHLLGVMAERGLPHAPSETNFIFFRVPDEGSTGAELAKRGVIVRPLSNGWIRASVGTETENQRFVTALDEVLS